MRFSLYIARRYLVSRKKHNAINIISGISAFGVMGGTIAFIIVLSVFNGFENLVLSLFNSFNADIEITAKEGKIFDVADFPMEKVKALDEILFINEVVEEEALLKYQDKQQIATLKGVGESYALMSGLDTMMIHGNLDISSGRRTYGVFGAGVFYTLGASVVDQMNPVLVYMPSRLADPGNVSDAFYTMEIFPSGAFSIQQDIDTRYALVPIEFMREILDYENEVSAIEIDLKDASETDEVSAKLKEILGDGYNVLDRVEQQAFLNKVIRSEKWAIISILSFILLLAIFNVIGSLTMLILEKQKDIAVLQSLGAGNRLIKRIFLIEGSMISFVGVIIGLIIGGLIAWIQQRYGVIGIGSAETLVIDAYPVQLKWQDFFLVFFTVMAIGLFSAWIPVRRLSGKYLNVKL